MIENRSIEDCIFCKPAPDTYAYLLHETPLFRVICDTHPLREGHLLIIPKDHVSCVGAYSDEQFHEFTELYGLFSDFILKSYRSVSTFEHGIFGQTVFHSHVHIIPYKGTPESIVPEGASHYRILKEFGELASELDKNHGYLFFSVGKRKWLVDTSLTAPRFFRDRYADALHNSERKDWKTARADLALMQKFHDENQNVIARWRIFSSELR